MIGVAALGGLAVGSAVALVLRRDRLVQLLALAVSGVALTIAFALAGDLLPALGMLLLGAVAETVLLVPAAVEQPDQRAEHRLPRVTSWVFIGLSALAGTAVAALVLASGVASRSALTGRAPASPTVAEVGRQLLTGTGVSILIAIVLLAALLVGGAALVRRDSREMAEDQAEAQRRRRQEAQRVRRARREDARTAARKARRGVEP